VVEYTPTGLRVSRGEVHPNWLTVRRGVASSPHRYTGDPDVMSDTEEVNTSVAEPEPPEPYHFDPRRTGTVSLLLVPVPVPVIKIPSCLRYICSYRTRLYLFLKIYLFKIDKINNI
jgi:hypothetical protein